MYTSCLWIANTHANASGQACPPQPSRLNGEHLPFLDTMAYKEESVNETSQMGYDKYPHEGKLREREFTMVIHQKKERQSRYHMELS